MWSLSLGIEPEEGAVLVSGGRGGGSLWREVFPVLSLGS